MKRDLPKLIDKINASIKAIKPYERYASAARLLKVMEAEKSILLEHLNVYKDIEKDKGKV